MDGEMDCEQSSKPLLIPDTLCTRYCIQVYAWDYLYYRHVISNLSLLSFTYAELLVMLMTTDLEFCLLRMRQIG